MLAIVDTGPLYAAVDANDQDHERCAEALLSPGMRLIVPALVVAEATYLIGARMGPKVEAEFLRGLTDLEVVAPEAVDWPRIGELVERYSDFPLGGTDASVVALAERLETPYVITLDHRHFRAIVPSHCDSLKLLPA